MTWIWGQMNGINRIFSDQLKQPCLGMCKELQAKKFLILLSLKETLYRADIFFRSTVSEHQYPKISNFGSWSLPKKALNYLARIWKVHSGIAPVSAPNREKASGPLGSRNRRRVAARDLG